jgi:sugar phosphate isomerase/epimerase
MQSLVDRRAFLKAAGGIAALTAPGDAWAANQGMLVTMRSLNGFWAAGAPPWNVEWQEFVSVAARAGYGGVDSLPYASMAKDGPDKVRARLAELKLKVGFLGCPTNPGVADEAIFRASLQRLGEVCEFATAVGCTRLVTTVLSSSDIPKEEWRKIVLDRMHAMAPTLEKHKVRVAVENLAPLHFRKRLKYEFLYTVPDIVALCKDGGPSFGLCLDAWHWHHSGGTVKDIVAAGKSQIIAVHLDDAKEQRPEQVQDGLRLMPGEGVINLTGFLRGLQQIGYEGNVSPEPLGRFPAGTPVEEVAKKTLEASIAVMKKNGIAIT